MMKMIIMMHLRCMEINLGHCKAASLAIAQIILDYVDLIQEPFFFSAVTPVVSNIPPGFPPFHQLSTNHAYSFIIIIRDQIVKSMGRSQPVTYLTPPFV